MEEAKTDIQLEAIKSEGGVWAEEIELNWSQVAVRDELLTLRNFLKQGMDFSVVEEMVIVDHSFFKEILKKIKWLHFFSND